MQSKFSRFLLVILLVKARQETLFYLRHVNTVKNNRQRKQEANISIREQNCRSTEDAKSLEWHQWTESIRKEGNCSRARRDAHAVPAIRVGIGESLRD